MTVTVAQALPEVLRKSAGSLIWEAFHQKLEPVLNGGDATGILARSIVADRVLAAVEHRGEGPNREIRLLGIAALDDGSGPPLTLDRAVLNQEFGRLGGAWRGLLVDFLQSEGREGEILIEYLCVDPAARSRGVGSTLLTAVAERAARTGSSAVRLEVVDTNPRAKALYEREGFRTVRSARVPWIRPLMGFSGYHVMLRDV